MDSSSNLNPIVVIKDQEKRPAFFKRIRAPFSKLSLPNKKIAGALVALLLVFGVGVGVFLAQRQTQLRPQASANGVDLKISPSALTVPSVSGEFDLDVVLDAKQASASAAQVKVTFDQTKLQLMTVTLSNFMPTVLTPPTIASGSAQFVVGTSTPHGGQGNLAKLHFKALALAQPSTLVGFDASNTIVTVTGLGTNQAGDLTPAAVTIGQGDPNVSPSPDVVMPKAYFDAQVPATVEVGDTFSVTLNAKSDQENANLFVAKMNFPANLLEVVSVDHTGSFATSWAEEYFNNTNGQISLVGGIPSPGFKTTGSTALFSKITFRAKAAGEATLDITDQSQIFSNATNTNIADDVQDHTISITADGVTPSPVVSPSPSPSPSPSVIPSPGNCQTLKGDGNADCVVNLTDLSIMLSNFSANNPTPAGKQLLDFNDDQRINTFDFSAMADKLFQLGIIRRRS